MTILSLKFSPFSGSPTSVLSLPAHYSEFGGRKPGHLLFGWSWASPAGIVVPGLLFDGAIFSAMDQFQDVLERLPC